MRYVLKSTHLPPFAVLSEQRDFDSLKTGVTVA